MRPLPLLLLLAGTLLFGCDSKSPSSKAPPLPPLPLFIQWREAAFGKGYVLMVTCTANAPTRFEFESMGRTKTLVIEPGKKEELGWAEGMTFADKDTVRISANGYLAKLLKFENKELRGVSN